MPKYFLLIFFCLSLFWPPYEFQVAGGVVEKAAVNLSEGAAAEYKIVTAYSASPDETDSTPCVGAWNERICDLQKQGVQVCATRAYPRNTKLKVGEIECVVKDKTSAKYGERIDILMPSKKDALQFGKQSLPVAVLE